MPKAMFSYINLYQTNRESVIMSTFKELYGADLSRYGGRPEVYLRIFHSFIGRLLSRLLRQCGSYIRRYFASGPAVEAWN